MLSQNQYNNTIDLFNQSPVVLCIKVKKLNRIRTQGLIPSTDEQDT